VLFVFFFFFFCVDLCTLRLFLGLGWVLRVVSRALSELLFLSDDDTSFQQFRRENLFLPQVALYYYNATSRFLLSPFSRPTAISCDSGSTSPRRQHAISFMPPLPFRLTLPCHAPRRTVPPSVLSKDQFPCPCRVFAPRWSSQSVNSLSSPQAASLLELFLLPAFPLCHPPFRPSHFPHEELRAVKRSRVTSAVPPLLPPVL